MPAAPPTSYSEGGLWAPGQHGGSKRADFPGSSVLANPRTGKRLALLMRQWDFDTGIEIQRCDLKCGRQVLWERPAPYLTAPFRMKGSKWAEVLFDNSTQPDVVFRLFDRAVDADEAWGCTIVLDTPPTKPMAVCQDTALPARGAGFEPEELDIPEKIRQMRRLYKYKGGSFTAAAHIPVPFLPLRGRFRRQARPPPWTRPRDTETAGCILLQSAVPYKARSVLTAKLRLSRRCHTSMVRSKFTISMAPWAHSAPLLPALVPVRSMACSMVSVVRTPNNTGTPLLSAAWAMPLDTSAHT